MNAYEPAFGQRTIIIMHNERRACRSPVSAWFSVSNHLCSAPNVSLLQSSMSFVHSLWFPLLPFPSIFTQNITVLSFLSSPILATCANRPIFRLITVSYWIPWCWGSSFLLASWWYCFSIICPVLPRFSTLLSSGSWSLLRYLCCVQGCCLDM